MASRPPSGKKRDELTRKIDQVRISVWKRVSEHEDSMQSLLARRANLEEEYGRRIREVLSGEEQTNKVGGAKHIEEVMKDERQSRSQNSGTPTKRGAVNHNDQAQMRKSSSGSILSAPLPEKGTNRAILAGRLEMEKSRLYDDLSREISALEVAQAQERAALHAAASEILQAVSSQKESTSTRRSPGKSAIPIKLPPPDLGGDDDDDHECDDDDRILPLDSESSGNPFAAYFSHQLERLRAIRSGSLVDRDSMIEEQELEAKAAMRASRATWALISAAGAEEATGAHAEAALLLYLQAAARSLPDLLAKSKQLQDGANQRGGDAARGDCIRAYAKSCLIGMLDGASQRNAHERSKGTAGHACSICVMERLGALGGKVSSERFVGGIVGALVRVVDGPRIIKAGLAARR